MMVHDRILNWGTKEMAVLPTASDGLENLEREKYSHFFKKGEANAFAFCCYKTESEVGGISRR